MNVSPQESKREQRHQMLVAGLLFLATAAVYWPVVTHEFTNFDDPAYVTDNQRVQQGLTLANVVWSFTTFEAQFWHPLTWLSHMLDCQFYGLKSAGHHLTNLLLHLVNTLLLFAVLRRMTGALWRSGAVAALFALHPLHVETVAWVAERKDVLSTFFWMLTLWAYMRYVEESKVRNSKSKVWYGVVVLLFVFGLMSKPMLVTLPFVLLLLDCWPLRRFELSALGTQPSILLRLVREKIPFFALAVVASAVAFCAEESGGTVVALSHLSLGDRVANALISYVRYLGKTLWPSDLAVFYPHPGTWPSLLVIGACLLLLTVTGLVVYRVRSRPYLAVGWFWYVGTLVPVIGLVQVGNHAMADRYTYVPLIGLFILLTWGMGEWVSTWRHRQTLLASLAGVVLAGCAAVTWFQDKHWRSTETLFRHALAVTTRNYVAHDNLGVALAEQGRVAEGIEHLEQSLRIKPDHADAQNNLGIALCQQGRVSEGLGHLEQGLRFKPGDAVMHYNAGTALWQLGRIPEAVEQYQQALRLKPDYARARTNLGMALFQLGAKFASSGKWDEAIEHFRRAVQMKPDNARAHDSLGVALIWRRRVGEAVGHFQKALELDSRLASAQNNLARILATETNEAIRNVNEAVRLAARACELTTNQVASYLDTLGVAYSEAGRFKEAVEVTERAAACALAAGDKKAAARIEGRLAHYRAGRAHHAIPAEAAP